MTNELMIENLNRLISNDVMERYFSPGASQSYCRECECWVLTSEAKRKATEQKAIAARIIVALTATDNPSAWAIEVANTVFDCPRAAIIRGELEDAPDVSWKWVSDRMRNHRPFFSGYETTVSDAQLMASRDGWGKTKADYKAERLKRGDHRPHAAECPNAEPIAA
jgi:hypothetical protein